MGRTWNEDTLNFFGIARVSYPKHIHVLCSWHQLLDLHIPV
uniref:Uncharacterized protein n=1 Tax=Manihot esculenta TaxID=3983 RepID=A0A2C9U5U7_MANES